METSLARTRTGQEAADKVAALLEVRPSSIKNPDMAVEAVYSSRAVPAAVRSLRGFVAAHDVLHRVLQPVVLAGGGRRQHWLPPPATTTSADMTLFLRAEVAMALAAGEAVKSHGFVTFGLDARSGQLFFVNESLQWQAFSSARVVARGSILDVVDAVRRATCCDASLPPPA